MSPEQFVELQPTEAAYRALYDENVRALSEMLSDDLETRVRQELRIIQLGKDITEASNRRDAERRRVLGDQG